MKHELILFTNWSMLPALPAQIISLFSNKVHSQMVLRLYFLKLEDAFWEYGRHLWIYYLPWHRNNTFYIIAVGTNRYAQDEHESMNRGIYIRSGQRYRFPVDWARHIQR